MKYFILAGEVSGDLHASNLMKHIKSLDSKAEFDCWGGDYMEKQGGKILKHINQLAFMGFIEVLMNLRTIARNFKLCVQHIKESNPDTIILIDYPGFNLRMAKRAKKMGYHVIYYISPTVWAWKESRVKTIKQYIDTLYVILPFEKDFYKKHDYPVEFEGHPLLDAIADWKKTQLPRETFLGNNNLSDHKIVALLPGSRKQELEKMLPLMLQLPSCFPDYIFVIAGTSSLEKSEYEKFKGIDKVSIVFDQAYDLLSSAHAAVVTSGTATLETALFSVPEVVCYKTSPVSFGIARMLVNIRIISLVNLIMDKEIVRELIQGDLTVENLKQELSNILNDSTYRTDMLRNFILLQEKLGGAGASKRIAEKIVRSIRKE
jgi:lipid-A-disaccharide synthase